MRKTAFVVVALILAAALCTAIVWAQGYGGNQRRTGDQSGFGRIMMTCPAMALQVPSTMMWERLGTTISLTADQKTKLNDIAARSEKAIEPVMQKASEATQALRNAVLGSGYDAERIKALAAAADKAELEIINTRIDTWTQIRSVLTPEQAAKLQEAMTMQRRTFPGRGTGSTGTNNTPNSQ